MRRVNRVDTLIHDEKEYRRVERDGDVFWGRTSNGHFFDFKIDKDLQEELEEKYQENERVQS